MTLLSSQNVRYLLHLAYNGTHFSGWQRQKNTSNTVQEHIESKLSILAREPITILGCGRTDKGVHAQQFFAHMNYPADTSQLIYKLNRMLPKDIVIYELIPVDASFNARFSATSRTYRYYFHTQPDPFYTKLSSYYDIENFEEDLFIKAIRLLPKYQEYRAFCKTPDKVDHTRCSIIETNLYATADRNRFCFEITANRFLRGMIRVLMHYLFKVAQGQMSIEDFEQMLSTGNNEEEIKYAYPQGLYLYRVVYPGMDVETDGQLSEFLMNEMEIV
jgi:tRNA pseudouridine38-40 synthase